jgi:PKD repeat protein
MYDPFSICTNGDFVGEWSVLYEGTAANPRGSTVDAAGDVYVIGFDSPDEEQSDYTTIKYDTDGNRLWVAFYDGPVNENDMPIAVAVDGAGNVYVTGESKGTGGGSNQTDIATVKYDVNGNQVWVARFNGPADEDDRGTGITVDDTGNVYVTGSTKQSGSGSDFITIKYDADGNQLWAAQYSGATAQDEDQSFCMAIDGNDNVYVAGFVSKNPNPGYYYNRDYATIKYDADGNQLWMATYEGPVGFEDQVTHLALDDTGNVYVTGESYGDGTRKDYATIKYDTNGVQLWVARYDNAGGDDRTRRGGLGLDDQGDVYVIGSSSEPTSHTVVIKYDNDGNEVWRAHSDFKSPDHGIVDAGGYTYVTGTTNISNVFVTKLDAGGNQVWNATVRGTMVADQVVAVDSNENIYVTTESDLDILTVKFSADPASGPGVDFSATPVSGDVPLAVTFSDLTVGSVDSWQWDFDFDGLVDSTVQNPSYTYNTPGTYSVYLQVDGPEGQRFLVKEAYITVGGLLIARIRNRTCSRGEIIRILGSGFGDIQGDSVVHIGNKTYDSTSPLIKLWSDTKIKFKVRRRSQWFERKAGKKVKVWVTVNGVDSNIRRIRPQFP